MKISTYFLITVGLIAGFCRLHAETDRDLGNLTDYPLVSEVWLGSIVGEVSVDPQIPIEVAALGDFQWRVDDGAVVVADQVIGLSDAKKIEISAKELELKRSRFQNALLDIQLASSDKKRALDASIQELESKLSEMEITAAEQQLLGAAFAKRLTVERKKLDKEIKTQKEKLEGDYFATSEIQDKQGLELDLQKAEKDHDDLIKSAEIVADTSGKVEIQMRGEIRKPMIIGQITKIGQAEVKLELSDPRVRNVAGSELVIDVNGEDGNIYHGTFSRDLKERSMNRNARICIFEIIPKRPDQPIPSALTGLRMVRISRKLPQPGYVLDKNKFLFQFSKEISETGWATFIEKRWPGVRVTYVAPKVVVVNSHEN